MKYITISNIGLDLISVLDFNKKYKKRSSDGIMIDIKMVKLKNKHKKRDNSMKDINMIKNR